MKSAKLRPDEKHQIFRKAKEALKERWGSLSEKHIQQISRWSFLLWKLFVGNSIVFLVFDSFWAEQIYIFSFQVFFKQETLCELIEFELISWKREKRLWNSYLSTVFNSVVKYHFVWWASWGLLLFFKDSQGGIIMGTISKILGL